MAKPEEKKFVPVMVTPFLENGKIDFDSLSQLIDFYLAAGVKGLFANCLSSEMYQLSSAERIALTKHVVKKVNGAVPVVATGSFGDSINEKVKFAKQIYDTGIHAVILITSHYAAEQDTDATLLNNIGQMVERTGSMRLGLYECPLPYKRIISPDVFKSLLDTKRFVYHKDTSIDIEKVAAKLALVGNNPLEFYDAHTANALFSLGHGARGLSAIAGNFYPEILVWMCNFANDPACQEDAKWLQSELDRAEDLISKFYPVSSKYFLRKRGVPMSLVCRSSEDVLTADSIAALNAVQNTFMGWCERLRIKPVLF